MATTVETREEPDATAELERVWQDPPGLWGWFASVQNNNIGQRYILTGFGFFIVGGIQALIMRVQLTRADEDLVSPELFNQLFTMHGSTMMFLFAVPTIEAFATYMIPFLIGARDLPFPRLTALGYWVYLFGGVMFQLSFLIGTAPDGGWFAYTPLTGIAYSPGVNIDFWLLGLGVIEVSGIAAAIELIVGILMMRAPGMSLNRIPLFAWSILVMAFMILFAFPAVIASSALLELDRAMGTQFFNPAAGGDPLLWQHLFWFFGHPDVYIMFLPAAGIISMIIPVFCRRPLAGYTYVVAATVAIGFLSFGLWVHHMFTTGISLLALSLFAGASLVIAIGSGVQVFAWIATIWRGALRWQTPFLFAVGFLVTFVVGGITGVMVAIAPFDWQVHDSYFIVAHFHYVLFGGVVFPILSGLYYWFPKIFGRLLSERLGILSFWLIFVGFHVAFFPMHITGILGMPRRVYTYPAGLGWELPNMISSAGAAVLALGLLLTMWNVFRSWRGGAVASDNPWDAGTLEWSVSSPPPSYNILDIPKVRSREPLWDSYAGPGPAADALADQLVDDQRRSHHGIREAFTTSMLEGEPSAIVVVASPSYRPLLMAFGLTIAFVGAIAPLHEVKLLTIGVGTVISVGALVAWLWPEPAAQQAWRTHGSNEYVHPLPTEVAGTQSPIWWGMFFYLVAVSVVFALFIYSYFYLFAGSDTWPPQGVGRPELTLAAVAVAVLLGAAVAVFVAERRIRSGRVGTMQVLLAVAWALSVLYLGLLLVEFARLPFTFTEHAYGSIFGVVLGFVGLHVLVVVGMHAVVQVRAALGHFTSRRYVAIQNVAQYTYFNLAIAVVAFITLYLSPYVLAVG